MYNNIKEETVDDCFFNEIINEVDSSLMYYESELAIDILCGIKEDYEED